MWARVVREIVVLQRCAAIAIADGVTSQDVGITNLEHFDLDAAGNDHPAPLLCRAVEIDIKPGIVAVDCKFGIEKGDGGAACRLRKGTDADRDQNKKPRCGVQQHHL